MALGPVPEMDTGREAVGSVVCSLDTPRRLRHPLVWHAREETRLERTIWEPQHSRLRNTVGRKVRVRAAMEPAKNRGCGETGSAQAEGAYPPPPGGESGWSRQRGLGAEAEGHAGCGAERVASSLPR